MRRPALGSALCASSGLLVAATAALGTSAATPPLGPRGLLPPWSLAVGPSSGLVTVLLALALLLGAGGLGLLVAALAEGWRPATRQVLAGGLGVVALLVLVPPLGSADHLSYAAYGRIAASGGDPYQVAPDAWRGGTDPVASAVRPPWRSTVSVYGPVATADHALAAALGDDVVRHIVLVLALSTALAVAAVGLLVARGGPGGVVLWLANPLVWWTLVAGAHVDALAVLPAVGAVLLLGRPQRWAPLAAGALAGVAGCVKLPYAVVLLALLWALRPRPRDAVAAAVGCVVVAATAYALVPDATARTGDASTLVSLASPWGPVAHALDGPLGFGTSRWVARVGAVVLALALLPVLRRLLPQDVHDHEGSSPVAEAAWAWLVLGTAYVLAAPYVLPWYDAIAWAPLAVLASRVPVARLRWTAALLLVHATVLALAYVPGRVEGLSPRVEDLTLGLRRDVAPWVAWALVLVLLLRPAAARWRSRRPAAG
ncbi:hypothetical protein EV189_0536 [Motilibacter rhizosphaerae]|uniref:Alpha-1,2-mannosyltransferase n=1 Tax=Motilibacter rhizosphaerae TaxID=598652 RepID=A0A4V2F521_9ACTN|nr:hypothetical protein [Motilibacter rhizosphaerae]RZS91299.1 hypothetical protein EV189_0536 [Motilibacter rhizosphaerae]